MDATKLQLKLFLEPGLLPRGGELSLESFIPVFHRWIKLHLLPELAIDVANYAHVPDGPGVVLIGDAHDYFIDQSAGGSLGLLVSRKRHAPPAEERFPDLFRRTLQAAALLEQEPALAGKLTFRTDRWLVRVNDRLQGSNDAATFTALRAALEPFARPLFAGATLTFSPFGTPRQLPSAELKVSPAPSLASLRERLGDPR